MERDKKPDLTNAELLQTLIGDSAPQRFKRVDMHGRILRLDEVMPVHAGDGTPAGPPFAEFLIDKKG